jgi:hypothetical protein
LRRQQRAAGVETKCERRARLQREHAAAIEQRSQFEKTRRDLLTAEQRRQEDARAARAARRAVLGLMAILR